MKCLTRLFPIVIAIIILASSGLAFAASYTLYEYYNENDDADAELYLANYFAQTFTVGSDSHTLETIRLKILAEGATPGNLYVSVRTTNASGYPEGIDLSTGAYSGVLLTTAAGGLWYEITMSSINLEAGETYAIVCYGTGTANNLNIHWRYDSSGPTYAGGQYFASTNGGVTWTATADSDFMFEVYGEATVEIDDVRIFETFKEDDWLIVTRYTCNDPLYEYADPAEKWMLQLLDGGGNVLASSPLQAWGSRPGSIYLSADTASALEWGNVDYVLRLQATYDVSSYVDFDIEPENWMGNVLTQLDSWCVYTAKWMDDIDSPTTSYIVETINYGDVLSLGGGSIFSVCIPNLEIIRPLIFYFNLEDFAEWEESTGPGTYETTLDDWETIVGTEVADTFNDAGALVGLSGRYIGGMIVFIVFLVLAGLAVSTGHFTAGLSLGSVMLIGGVLMGLIPMAAIFVAIALLVVLWIKNFWWQGA